MLSFPSPPSLQIRSLQVDLSTSLFASLSPFRDFSFLSFRLSFRLLFPRLFGSVSEVRASLSARPLLLSPPSSLLLSPSVNPPTSSDPCSWIMLPLKAAYFFPCSNLFYVQTVRRPLRPAFALPSSLCSRLASFGRLQPRSVLFGCLDVRFCSPAAFFWFKVYATLARCPTSPFFFPIFSFLSGPASGVGSHSM